ncbi:peptidoglycan recognition family protein [Streptomyces microflavus]|uniref:peptidoglycan recognition protein family protein n=1 Tax=Streptomyces microflavus TaxID=1919 RepID=UPI0035D54B8E
MKLVTRAQLGWPVSAAPSQPTAKGVKVHYLGSPVSTKLLADHQECLALWKDIRRSHLANKTENYSDVAYNYAGCPHGYLLEGRGLRRRTGANGNQALNIAHYAIVGLVGSSGLTEPPDAMLSAIRDGIDLLRGDGAGKEIKGHRDGYATACPGGPLYAWVKAGAPRPKAEPEKPPAPAPAKPAVTPEEDDLVPTVLTESSDTDTEVPGGGWSLLAMAKDSALLQGPCSYSVTAYATVIGAPGTRVAGRFQDLTVATKRASLDLPMDAGVIGPDGRLDVALTRPGRLASGVQLRLEFLASAPVTVTYRVLRGLVWR